MSDVEPLPPPRGPSLVAGLSDMIEGGRLTAADCPDDFDWLCNALEAARPDLRPVVIPAIMSADVRVEVAVEAYRADASGHHDALMAAAGYLYGKGMVGSAVACFVAVADLHHLRWRRGDLLESNNRYLEQARAARGQVSAFRELIDKLIGDLVASPAFQLNAAVTAQVEVLQTIRERTFGAKLIVDEAVSD